MNLLANLGMASLAAGLVLAGDTRPANAQAKNGLAIVPVSNAALTAPVRNTGGKVKSIAGRVIVLDVDGRDVAFTVDEHTTLIASGGSHATQLAGGRLPITDFLRRGDMARVAYRELSGSRWASEIQIKRTIIAVR